MKTLEELRERIPDLTEEEYAELTAEEIFKLISGKEGEYILLGKEEDK